MMTNKTMRCSTFRNKALLALAMTSDFASTRCVDGLAIGDLSLEKLTAHATSYASARGLQVEKRTGDGSSVYECAPMSLLPNAYPREAFLRAQSLALPFNLLVDRISRDGDFLTATLGEVADADPFTGKLLELYKAIYIKDQDRFATSADRLGILRSDYMLNVKGEGQPLELKQVELNTIAASFAGLAVNVAALHRHLIARFDMDVNEFLCSNKGIIVGAGSAVLDDYDGVPENPALTCLPEAMNVAHERYKSRFPDSDPIILFVVQDGETNTVDQRMLEFGLWEAHGIPVVRISLTRAYKDLQVDPSSGALHITTGGGNQEVAVVYFRAGYAPTDYPDGYSGIEWDARERIERSRATKCPNLGYHLAGTKKVQQELARPLCLERFFGDTDEASTATNVRRVFAGLYSLGDDATIDDFVAVKDALNGSEDRYVLKPQREGGGYNFYGVELADKLKENTEQQSLNDIKLGKELAEFILMERLFPPQQQAILLRSGKVQGSGESISELGCFGAVVASSEGDVVHNKYAGFLLRTKFSNVDEGGVASGFATLSSPFLC
jgi:glutathione synthase